MNKFDLDLKLLAGLPLEVEDIIIEPKKLREIIGMNYSVYNKHIGFLTITHTDLYSKETLEEYQELKKVTIFDVLVFLAGEELKQEFINSLHYFLGTYKHEIDSESGILILEKGKKDYYFLNSSRFARIVDYIKFQNCIEEPKEKIEEQPVDEKTRKILEKLQKGKQEATKLQSKNNTESNIDFYSIISAVSTKSHGINKLNIWDLTIYQLYDEYKRLSLIDNYETSIQAIMNGADMKGEKLPHWSERIED
jgi:hypothetical protein